MFTCIQWNARSVTNKKVWLRHAIFSQACIIAIQETFLKKHHSFFIHSFNIVRADREGRPGGGVLLAIRKSIPYLLCTHPTDPTGASECISVKLKLRHNSLQVINVYSAQGHINYTWLTNVIQTCDTPFLLVGDLNTNLLNTHVLATRKFIQWCDEHDLHFLNTQDPTRTNINSKASLLDITICSKSIASGTTSYVHPDLFNSDHHPITTSCNIHYNGHQNLQRKTIIKWVPTVYSINQKCQRKIENYDEFNHICKQAISSNSFQVYETNCSKNPPYWDWECSKLLATKRRLLRKAKTDISPQLWSEFKSVESKLRLIIQQKSTHYWNKTCKKALKDKSIFKIINNMKNRNNIPRDFIFKHNGTSIHEPEEQAALFLDFFTKDKQHRKIPYDLSGDNKLINSIITHDEVLHAIHNTKNTSPGKEGIPATIFKMINTEAKNQLTAHFNNILDTGDIPNSWKHAVIVPIKKPGKPQQSIQSYRPIALTEVSAKIFERVLLRRIIHHLILQEHIHPNHYGYLPYRDSQTMLTSLSEDIISKRNKHKFIFLVGLDIKEAYDNVWIDGLIHKCQKLDINGKLGFWLTNFLNDRTIQVRWRGKYSQCRKLNAGVPQGSVLSAILYTIFMHDIFDTQVADVTIKVFADDIFLYISGNNYDAALRKLQATINNIVKWCQFWHLYISTNKCTAINLSHSKKTLPNLMIENLNIPWVNEIQILGVRYNRKFSLNPHIKHLQQKAYINTNLLRSFTNNKWGIPCHKAIEIINATIRSLIDYGSPIFCHLTNTNKMKLEILYNKALRVATNLPKATPIPVLRKISNQPSISSRIVALHQKHQIKAISNSLVSPYGKQLKHQSQNQHNPNMDLLYNLLNYHNLHIDNILQAPWIPSHNIPHLNIITKDLPFQQNNVSNIEILTTWNWYHENIIQNNTLLASDASKDSNKTTIAILNSNKQCKYARIINHHNSVFTAEVTALEYAISMFINSSDKYYAITDSMSCLEALKHINQSSPSCIKQLHQTINRKLQQGGHLNILWVPGHAGIGPNEDVDKLAKHGPFVTNDYHKVDTNDIIAIIRKNQQTVNEYEWLQSDHYSTFDYLQSIDHKFIQSINLNRSSEVALYKWNTKQIKTNQFLYKIQQRNDPLCQECMILENPEHILFHCVKFTQQRQCLFNQLGSIPISFSDAMSKINRSKANIRAFLTFHFTIDKSL